MQNEISASLEVTQSLPRLSRQQKAVLNWAIIEEHEKVLDLNCTEASLLWELSRRYQLIPCGISETYEQSRGIMRVLENGDVMCGRVDDIPWRDQSMDVVLSSRPPQEYDQFDLVLREVLRVLRPGGQFVLSVPFTLDAALRPNRVMCMLEKAGFTDVSWRMSWLTGVCIGWKNRPETSDEQAV